MKKIKLYISLVLILLLVSCNFNENYRVEIIPPAYLNQDSIVLENIDHGSTIDAPNFPENNEYDFLGWYTDKERTQKWDFNKDKVKSDLILYPLWDKKTENKDISQSDNMDRYNEFSNLKTPGKQEMNYDYDIFYLPKLNGTEQAYIGDPMPYYEDGVFYIYYLKDGGNSYNHSIFLLTTKDFLTYKEYDSAILESSRNNEQDAWIGTGSVVKVKDIYYLFYTAHNESPQTEFNETIMVARGSDLFNFEKIDDWELEPPEELNQKQDFRDPQAYYNEEKNIIELTITASKNGVASILKYSLSVDLEQAEYEGVIFTDPTKEFWNLECSDTFKINDTWYITYSAQDDTLWYAKSENRYGHYVEPKRLEDKLFYAAKHVQNESNHYMVGWARRSESPSSTSDVGAWGGNLLVQELEQDINNDLILKPVQEVEDVFKTERDLLIEDNHLYLDAGTLISYGDVFRAYEKFKIKGEFIFSGEGSFGLSFDYNGDPAKNKFISICPKDELIKLNFNEGKTTITEVKTNIQANKLYEFIYIQEGSVGTFYLDDVAITVRLYGVTGKPIQFFTENNQVELYSLRQYT